MKLHGNSVDWSRVEKQTQREHVTVHWRPYGMPGIIAERSRISGAEEMPTWAAPSKAIISAAVNGAFFTKAENPNQPITPEEIIASAEGCIAEGAQVVHVHARDSRGYNVLDPKLFSEVLGHLRKQHPAVAFDACLVAVDAEESDNLKAMLKSGLIDGVPVNTTAIILGDNLFVKPPHAIIEKTRLVVESGLVPQLAVYTDGDVDNARRLLIDSGVLRPPLTWLVLSGLPGCTPMYSPDMMVDGLMRQVRLIRHVDPEGMIIVCAGGRASLHLATLALLLGHHVRIGMEDTMWTLPHSNEPIVSNAAYFRTIRGIAESIGRELMPGSVYKELASRRLAA